MFLYLTLQQTFNSKVNWGNIIKNLFFNKFQFFMFFDKQIFLIFNIDSDYVNQVKHFICYKAFFFSWEY